MKMSWGNCYVKVSWGAPFVEVSLPHGDLHDEPEGVAPGRPGQGRPRTTHHQSARSHESAAERPAISALEAPPRDGRGHQSRGQPSAHRLPAGLRTKVTTLMSTVYAGFNDVHLTEKLREVEQLPLSRESVRRLRLAAGRPAQRPRRAPRYRRRRTPAAAAGALVQTDGSPFAWLEDRGPRLTLLGVIDDATGQILALRFREAEDLHGYTGLFHEVFTIHGLPLAVYGDRLNVFVRNDRHWTLEEQLAGQRHPTHLGRMFQDLGISYISAHSPQAKGRIERLWATLQDRLASELRLRGLKTPAAAEAYLPEFIADFNARFAHPPATTPALWRRPPRDLALVLSCRYTRVVARDHTIRLGERRVQLPSRA